VIRARALIVALAGACLAACGDPDQPPGCGPVESCVPQAANLRVDSVRIETAGAPHPGTGRGIARGDSVSVHFSITNAGRAPSGPRNVNAGGALIEGLTTEIPALAPGQTHRQSLRLALSAHWVRAGTSDATAVTIELDPQADDAGTVNKSMVSDSVHLELPMLAIEVAPASVPRVRANEPFPMQITVRNTSVTTPARDIQLRHCLWDYDVSCWPRYWAAFGTVELDDLAPGATRELTYMLSIPPEATYFDITVTYYLSVCITPDDHDGPYTEPRIQLYEWHCGNAFFIEVWPDFEACPPAMLGNGPVTLAAANCGFYPPSDPPQNAPHRIFVWALDAAAGVTYQVQGLPGPVNDRGDPVADLDPAANRLRFARSGRYYFVVHAQAGPRTGSADALNPGPSAGSRERQARAR
jgi:hypothetical protein